MTRARSTTFGHGAVRWRGCTLASVCLLATSPAWSDTFSGAHYDPKTDELVVTMVYGGSNPDHQFSVQWGECQNASDGGNMHQIAVDVIDSQWNDVAKQTYSKTVRFSVAGLSCRPATVTLRTAPRYEVTLQIP
jgi:hypothetical protein